MEVKSLVIFLLRKWLVGNLYISNHGWNYYLSIFNFSFYLMKIFFSLGFMKINLNQALRKHKSRLNLKAKVKISQKCHLGFLNLFLFVWQLRNTNFDRSTLNWLVFFLSQLDLPFAFLDS